MLGKIITWTPRVLSIFVIALLFLLSFDMLLAEFTIWEKILGVLIQNIPTAVFGVILYLSWKRPWVGGIFYLAAGIFYLWLMRNSDDTFVEALLSSLGLAIPVFVTGVLFILDWKMNERG